MKRDLKIRVYGIITVFKRMCVIYVTVILRRTCVDEYIAKHYHAT